MEPLPTLSEADAILQRLQRLVSLWRALLIVQLTLILLGVVLGLMELLLPGVLPRLFRGYLSALPVLVAVLVLVACLDVGSALVERAMGNTLRVERTTLRLVATALTLVPGILLLRRVLVVVLALGWLAMLLVSLFLYVVVVVISVPRFASRLNRAIGLAVDFVDRVLSGLYAWVTRGLMAISASPVIWLEVEEHVVLRLLRRGASMDESLGFAKE